MTPAFVGGAALVGDDLTRVDPAVVVVDGWKVVAAGPPAAVTLPPGAEIVDVSGTTMLPGFIDAHVHIGLVEPDAIVRGGVTTVRDLAWPPDEIAAIADLANEGSGPTVLFAGPMLTVADGYPTGAEWAPPGTGVVVADPGLATDVVNVLHGRGIAIVKVALNGDDGPTLDAATLQAIVEGAHDVGLKVTAHVTGIDELHKALDAGVDELAHMPMGHRGLPPETVERMVEAGIAVVPTLSIHGRRDAKVAVGDLRSFVAAGGRVVYGTDLGNEGPVPGIDRKEIRAMARAGMSPAAVIRSATVDAAAWLGLDEKGVIRPGADADLIAVGGDPTAELDALLDVRRVWRLGREIPRGS